MYEAYYNFKLKPFGLNPDPDFLYLSQTHKRAVHYLQYGIREKAGFILLTGEVGSGKTTLISDLIKRLARQVILAKVFHTKVSSEQLLALINDDFGLESKGKDKITLFKDLNDFLIEQHARKMNPVLIIDEAQNLKPDQLEEIRMLSNLETSTSKLIQIVLVGQPELRDILSLPQMRQLRQRISINCRICPLTKDEMVSYVFHRLEVAGNKDALTFSEGTFELMHQHTRGIPRLVNIMCDFLLLTAFIEETKNVDVAMVKDIVNDLDFESLYWGSVEQQGNGKGNIDYSALLNALGIQGSA